MDDACETADGFRGTAGVLLIVRGGGKFFALVDTPDRPEATRAAHVRAFGAAGDELRDEGCDEVELVDVDAGLGGIVGAGVVVGLFVVGIVGGVIVGGVIVGGGIDSDDGCAESVGGVEGRVVFEVRAMRGRASISGGDGGGEVAGDASWRSHCSTVREPNCILETASRC